MFIRRALITAAIVIAAIGSASPAYARGGHGGGGHGGGCYRAASGDCVERPTWAPSRPPGATAPCAACGQGSHRASCRATPTARYRARAQQTGRRPRPGS